jgi:molybdopterin converting factor small subunit
VSGSGALTVRVRLFAGLREAMGWSDRQVPVTHVPATALTVWRQLQLAEGWTAACGAAPGGGEPTAPGCHPEAAGALPTGVRVAVNQAFAGADTSLADGDELAFLPPISGG